MDKRTFYYEPYADEKGYTISYNEIRNLALEHGDERDPEDMDDDSFLNYCAFIIGE